MVARPVGLGRTGHCAHELWRYDRDVGPPTGSHHAQRTSRPAMRTVGTDGWIRPSCLALRCPCAGTQSWMVQARGDLRPPEGVDAPAVNALIVSAISYFVLASRTSNTVIGLSARRGDVDPDRDSTRLLVQGAYGKA